MRSQKKDSKKATTESLRKSMRQCKHNKYKQYKKWNDLSKRKQQQLNKEWKTNLPLNFFG